MRWIGKIRDEKDLYIDVTLILVFTSACSNKKAIAKKETKHK